jgi:replicative DNA helicase
MASLRESSELEYGCDDCLLLYPTEDKAAGTTCSMVLQHEKSRYGECKTVAVQFEPEFQRFKVEPFIAAAKSRPIPSKNGRI